MKRNNWLLYLSYSVLLLFYIIFGNTVLVYFRNQAQMTFKYLPYMLWSIVIFIVLGLLLGLESFLLEKRKEGKWKVNLPKLLFLGIPSLYFSVGILINYCPIDFIRETLGYPYLLLSKLNINFMMVFQIVFGYIISTSFIKVNE